MLIQRKSPMSGKENVMDLNITDEQINRWHNGELIQDAMPNLSADEREFLISGLTPEESAEFFAEPEEDGNKDETDHINWGC